MYSQEYYVSSFGIKTSRIEEGTWEVTALLELIELSDHGKDPQVYFEIRPVKGGKQLKARSHNVTSNRDEYNMEVSLKINTSNVKMWYPKGAGEQNLYNLTVNICVATECIESSRKFGFRTVELNQDSLSSQDARQRRFEFIINSQPVYIKGANLVPLSVFEVSACDVTSRDKTKDMFDRVEFGGINTLRIWGGGVYREEEFYDEADRRGIMLWQVKDCSHIRQ